VRGDGFGETDVAFELSGQTVVALTLELDGSARFAR
jgi:hypothetical protein